MLPAYRNVDALYDVPLRVDGTARAAAPAGQVGALDAALAKLDDGRRALGDSLQLSAVAAEKRVGDLEAAAKVVVPVAAAVCPPAVVAAPAPAKKKTARPPVKPVTPTAPPQ
jgi:hypothetical protein